MTKIFDVYLFYVWVIYFCCMRGAILDIARDHLFDSVDEMQAHRLAPLVQQRLIRLRDIYNYWLQYPALRDRDIVLEIQKRYDVKKTIAYNDLAVIKYLLGDLNKVSKDYARYRFIQRNEETRAIALRLKDARAAAACDNYYGKYMQLDKEDARDLGFDQIVVQPFQPDTDPSIVGIKPVPNIREKIASMLKKYWSEDVEDVRFEEAEYDEEKLFQLPAEGEEVLS